MGETQAILSSFQCICSLFVHSWPVILSCPHLCMATITPCMQPWMWSIRVAFKARSFSGYRIMSQVAFCVCLLSNLDCVSRRLRRRPWGDTWDSCNDLPILCDFRIGVIIYSRGNLHLPLCAVCFFLLGASEAKSPSTASSGIKGFPPRTKIFEGWKRIKIWCA